MYSRKPRFAQTTQFTENPHLCALALEEGAVVFDQPRRKSNRQKAAEARRIDALEAKVQEKNEVLAELMGEHVALKKTLGEI